MLLYHAVYFSKRPPGSAGDLDKIFAQCRHNNAAAGITGALMIDPRYYVQVLEGQRSVLTKLLQRIIADPRHTDCTLALFDAISERNFGDWVMRRAELCENARAYLEACGWGAEVEPSRMTGTALWDVVYSCADRGCEDDKRIA